MSVVDKFPTKRIVVGGLGFNVVDVGEGKPVLLIHGYPDSHTAWRHQIPVLVKAGYRVIAPDTRGRGDSDMAERVEDYKWSLLASDMVAILDALDIKEKVPVIGHDWGSIIGWQVAIGYPERVEKYIAMSVGHPNSYSRGGFMQKLKGWYIFLMQLRGIFEFSIRAFDWAIFRISANFPEEMPDWIRLLEQPGRLTAAANYYRANFVDMVFKANNPNVKVPVVGVFSNGDIYLTEGQMKESERYCDSGFKYYLIDGGVHHWMQLAEPERVNEILLENLNPATGE